MDSVKNESPWKYQNFHNIKPTIDILKKEIKRRDGSVKGISNMKLEFLLTKLKEQNSLLQDNCVEFIKKEFERFKAIFNHCAE